MSLKSTIRTRLLTIDLSGVSHRLRVFQWLIMRSLGSKFDAEGGNNVFIRNIRDFRSSELKVSGQRNQLHLAGKLEECRLTIEGDGNVISVAPGCFFQCTEFTVIANDSWIRVGAGGTANGKPHAPNLLLVRGGKVGIDVDEDAMLAYGVEIRTTDSHKIFDTQGNCVNTEKSVRVGKHVWLGARCAVLKGVEISSGAIVAAGAIVSGGSKVPSNVIFGGIPAKLIRQGVNWIR